jgi:uncharacterized membrane protein
MGKRSIPARRNRALSVVLALVIIGVIVALVYVMAIDQAGEKFTEFYILNYEGKSEDYPRELVLGEEAMVRVGLVNRERETVSYDLEIRINQVRVNRLESLVLNHGEKREETMGFRPETVGRNQKVEFLLYKSGENEAYKSLYLWVDVGQGD